MDGDRGSVTAELAVVLPAVAALVAALAWGLQLAAVHVRLQDAAAQSARALARGDPIPERAVAAAAPDAAAASHWEEGLVCVQVTATAAGPLGLGVALGAGAGALGGGSGAAPGPTAARAVPAPSPPSGSSRCAACSRRSSSPR